MLLAEFWHARYLTNEILWNVEQKYNYTRLHRETILTSVKAKNLETLIFKETTLYVLK